MADGLASLGRQLLLASDYAYEWLLKKPAWLPEIYQLRQQDIESLAAILKQQLDEIDTDAPEFELKQQLRHLRHFWSIICIALDLEEIANIRQITRLQSQLAIGLIQQAYRWCFKQYQQQYGTPMDVQGNKQQLAILAMGKLGGMELNFSSDVDLIFCYPSEGETDTSQLARTPIENSKFFTRLGQKLVALLHETNADGFVHRVDMRLRPYGESGALALSFDAMADYYLEQGREWERFAMIKAQVLCDDLAAKKQLESIIKPFSFRRYIDFSVLEAIRQLKLKISAEMRNRNLHNNIKLGFGGIRELEFIVQSLQLISGGRFPELQAKNWWQSLEQLIQRQLIPANKAQALQQAYQFLRRLENRLQFRANAQTQDLPDDEIEQQIIAWLMDFNTWSEFAQAFEAHKQRVETFFNDLFHDPNSSSQENSKVQLITKRLFALELTENEQKQLSELQIESVLIERLQQFRRQFVDEKLAARGRKRLNQLLPNLLLNLTRYPKPQALLEACLSILQSIGRRTAYFELLAENPPLLEHLVELASRSKWLVEQLKQYPSLLDELLFPSNFGKILSKADFQDLLKQALLRIEPEEVEEQLLAIGRFKVASQFKVAAGFLSQRFSIEQVTRQLTDIAEIILQALLQLAWRDLALKFGTPEGASPEMASNFAVIGYGKLGGHELGFDSDLDLVFLYQGEPQAYTNGKKSIEVSQFYTRLTQRLVHYLNARTAQGIMYEVDTRLRPSGRSGLLVSELRAFCEYQKNEAWTWEKQALVRARAVAGDSSLIQAYQSLRSSLLVSNADLTEEVAAMRQKMKHNLDRSNDQVWDIKQGVGGLVDLEFLVQFWVLKAAQQGTSLPDIYSNDYWLDWLLEKNIISQQQQAQFKSLYASYQDLINHQRLQMQPATIAYEAVPQERQIIIDTWDSTFGSSTLQ